MNIFGQSTYEFYPGEQRSAVLAFTNPTHSDITITASLMIIIGQSDVIRSDKTVSIGALGTKTASIPITMPLVVGMYPVILVVYHNDQEIASLNIGTISISEVVPEHIRLDLLAHYRSSYGESGVMDDDSVLAATNHYFGDITVPGFDYPVTKKELDAMVLEWENHPIRTGLLSHYRSSFGEHDVMDIYSFTAASGDYSYQTIVTGFEYPITKQELDAITREYHFGIAEFSITNLTTDPTEVYVNQQVSIDVTVQNTGDVEGEVTIGDEPDCDFVLSIIPGTYIAAHVPAVFEPVPITSYLNQIVPAVILIMFMSMSSKIMR